MYDIKTKTLVDERELLRIKTLALLAEVSIIRKEEAKQARFSRKHAIDPALQRKMYLHRTKDLRPIQRYTHIARGFIKGLPLPRMENYPVRLLQSSEWDAIAKMVKKYGSAQSVSHMAAQRAEHEGKVYAVKPAVVRAPKAPYDAQARTVSVTE